MHRFRLAALALLLPGCTFAAHATTITAGTYVLENASVAGYAVTGTVTLNSAGTATSANLTVNAPAYNNPSLPVLTSATLTAAYNGISQNYLSSSAGQVALVFNTASDSSGHYALCLGYAQCGTSSGTTSPSTLQLYGFYNANTHVSVQSLASTQFTSGYLVAQGSVNPTPVAATPEPASLLLLSTGVFGLGGLGLRSRRQRLTGAPLQTAAC